MSELPRLNGIIRALEQGQATFTCFSPAEVDSALAMSVSKYDGVVFEMEHNPWDARALRESLQFMLNRAPDRAVGLARTGGDADGAHSAERRREGPMARQAGARSRLLRHRLAAYQLRWMRPTTLSRPAAIRV